MALIKCPECEKMISSMAIDCPNCGYPIQDYLKEKNENSSNDEISILNVTSQFDGNNNIETDNDVKRIIAND